MNERKKKALMARIIPSLCAFFLCVTLHSQDLKFSHLTLENGLSQSVVNCIMQDSHGFMWFGTQEGLNRYDGYNFRVFKRDPGNKNSLSNNFIYALLEDKSGKIWIGTNGGGLDVFDPVTEKFTHYNNDPKDPSTISNDIIHSIRQTKDGKIWIGTDNGLNCFDVASQKFEHYLNNPNDEFSLSENKVYELLEDEGGKLWIGTYGKGIAYFDRTSRKFYNYMLSDDEIVKFRPKFKMDDERRKASYRQIRSMLSYDTDHLWIGTNGGGIFVFNKKTMSFEAADMPLCEATMPGANVLALRDDGSGKIWISVFDHGVEIFNKYDKTIESYLPNELDNYAISSTGIKCITLDKDGNIWIGTSGEGINMFFRSTSIITHIRRSIRPETGENTLQSDKIVSVMEDHSGLLWIGTLGGGLTTFDRTKNIYTQHPELSTSTNNSILSLLESSDSTIWIGTYGEGLNHYDPKTGKITTFTPSKGLQDGNIMCITEEPVTHAIWFGTLSGGIYRVDPHSDSLTHFTKEKDSLSTNSIYSLFFDHHSNLWIGTRACGVMMRARGSSVFKSYQHSDDDTTSLSNNIVYCVAEDKNQNIWLATANGLNRYVPAGGKFDILYEQDGLPSDNIYAVVPDMNGNLWISHNKGITECIPIASGPGRFRNFGPASGVQTAEFNQGAYFHDAKGILFFGGQGGLNIIDPASLDEGGTSPEVFIISYKRFGQEIKQDTAISAAKTIRVSWRDNNFQFELAALNYVEPSKNLYQYKLEGIDDDWSKATTNRYVSYTNLPGGDYELHVRAADSNGHWSDDRVIIRIHVEPPFWKTTWFYMLCVVVVITGFILFVRYRTASIKKENRILETKVAERTHELAQKNADITASIQYAKRIQVAMLPEQKAILKHFPESFVLYKPKDIVSGDFYWFAEKDNKAILAVADCTGHGVPGALMSMIGHDLLNQIVREKGVTDPGEILNMLDDGVRVALKQDHSDQDTTDGMDIALCVVDKQKKELLFGGALRPLIFVRKGLLSRMESDRFPIGGSQDTRDKRFTTHKVIIEPGDIIYMFSDGFADQFGGERGKKFMMKHLLEKLRQIHELPMPAQSQELETTFDQWKQGLQQVDDVLVVGVRIP